MFSCNFRQYFYIFPLNCVVVVYIIATITSIAVGANDEFEPSNIVFQPPLLKRQRSFEVLTSSAVTNDSVIELSRAAEAFSLEYFQVKIEVFFVNMLNLFEILIFSLVFK